MPVTTRETSAMGTRMALLQHLKCPAGSPRCSVGLELQGNVLACQCGGLYTAHGGVLDLRLGGEWNLEGHQNVDGDRYLSNTFVNSFYRRQYGCLVETAPLRKTAGRIPEFRGGAESYYQTMIGMVVPHVQKESLVVDVGCALGRLTGEMAKVGARIALGLDFSPAMAWRANEIMTTPVTENIALALPETRLKTNPGTLAGWGLENCVFAAADAQRLPLQARSVDVMVCSNLLHRVPDPQQVLSEIERATRQGSVVLISNSYDWSEEFSEPKHWFDDVTTQLAPAIWRKLAEVDGVPYLSSIHNRKFTHALNHIVLMERRS